MIHPSGKNLLIVDVAALGMDLLRKWHCAQWNGLEFQPLDPVFPAVTCTAQASFRTAEAPARHGMVANGLFHPSLQKVLFWEQSSNLVEGERIWDHARREGTRVGMLFWQQSLGEAVDVVLSPAPIHKHHGGMIEDCYSRPRGLYAHLCDALGKPFRLRQYWGPLASAKVGDWIARATAEVMADRSLALDVVLTYLPSLDYALQRHGPDSRQAASALKTTFRQLDLLRKTADDLGWEMLLFGDYDIAPASRALYPNRHLRDADLFQPRTVGRRTYPDLYASRVFAMVDHEIAHVYVRSGNDIPAVADALRRMDGIDQVLDPDGQRAAGIDHSRSGEFVLLARPGCWFAYPWWTQRHQAPDFASHVDIHNKPGFDPCELYFGFPPPGVSRNTARIRGSHGRAGQERQTAWAATFPLPKRPDTLLDLATTTRDLLDQTA